MGRSSAVNGASVALELLPRQIEVDGAGANPVLLRDAPAHPPLTADQALAALSTASLTNGTLTVALAPAATRANLAAALAAPVPADAWPDLISTRLPEALGHILLSFLSSPAIPPQHIYQLALGLAALARSAEAKAILAVIDPAATRHPAILALRGYLDFQTGEADQGRKALARAALGSRAVPQFRSILHFTQHVLLTQQFGA